MNRTLVLGTAIFFAVVGIALLGGEKSAMAGHRRCCGCAGAPAACSGCQGGGLFHRNRCNCAGPALKVDKLPSAGIASITSFADPFRATLWS